jgi:DegV family protein with EDD domain
MKTHIVTDSAARYSNTRIMQQFPITTVPNKIRSGQETYQEDVDIDVEELLSIMSSPSQSLAVEPPSIDDFASVYTRLSHVYDHIVSVHPSRELSKSWENARRAAAQVSGSVEVAVIDSRSICAGQGMLLRVAGQAILDGADFETIVKKTRSAVERLYAVYYVESLEYLHKNQIMSNSRTILGAMLGIKPFLSIEEGRIIVIEKVKTRTQAIERLVEFLIEFEDIDDAVIIQPRTHITEQTRIIQDRLSMEFPGKHFPYTLYGASLASLIGTTATGIYVLESEIDTNLGLFDDDF